jgi:hypothetical protein
MFSWLVKRKSPQVDIEEDSKRVTHLLKRMQEWQLLLPCQVLSHRVVQSYPSLPNLISAEEWQQGSLLAVCRHLCKIC